MTDADIIVANQDRSCAYEVWFPQPHLNVDKKIVGDGYIELEIEPAWDMGDERQRPHLIRLSDGFVANFATVEWAARYALMEAVIFDRPRECREDAGP